MNFYKRFPGDYAKKTSRLTLAQHGAYTLLLDEIYVTEAGLPESLDELYRICRAMTKPEQDAVRVVAERYFPVGPDGLRQNERAQEELAAAAPAIEAARLNGKKGGRPPKKPTGLFPGNPGDNQGGTPDEPGTKAPHSPDKTPSVEGVPHATPGEACKAMKAAGMADLNPSHPKLIALLAAGITVDELVDAAKNALKNSKPFAYALAAAEGRRRDAATAPLPNARPASAGRHHAAAAAVFDTDDSAVTHPEVIDV